jgi:zinc/manganese transport system substrate-binding protein
MLKLKVLAVALLFPLVPAWAEPLKVLAAENFYGDIARQIGGEEIEVKSILSNPDQDPHLFEASHSVARSVAEADIVIVNGVDYDPWMDKLLAATPSPKRRVIVAGDVAARKSGENPHLWYDLAVSKAMARSLAENLAQALPEKATAFNESETKFEESLKPLESEIAKISQAHAGTSVAAIEPVFGYMLEAMSLDVREKSFQLAVMNDAEPAVSDVARFEDDLKGKVVKLFVYNSQATDPVADRLMALAKAGSIPVVAVTETMPASVTYQQWLTDEVDAVAKALDSQH